MSGSRKGGLAVRASIVGAFVLVIALNVLKWTAPRIPATARAEPGVSIADSARGWTEIDLIYIGDPGCPACASDIFKESLSRGISRLRRVATEGGQRFRTVGVSLTRDFEEGLTFLSDSGDWDELSLGGAWLNRNVTAILASRPLPLMTPQVIVVVEEVWMSPNGHLLVQSLALPHVSSGTAEVADLAQVRRIEDLFPLGIGHPVVTADSIS